MVLIMEAAAGPNAAPFQGRGLGRCLAVLPASADSATVRCVSMLASSVSHVVCAAVSVSQSGPACKHGAWRMHD
jgi:hypothetical protein